MLTLWPCTKVTFHPTHHKNVFVTNEKYGQNKAKRYRIDFGPILRFFIFVKTHQCHDQFFIRKINLDRYFYTVKICGSVFL